MKTIRAVGAFLTGAILSTVLYYGLRSPADGPGERSPAPLSELRAGAATTPADSRVRAAEGLLRQRPQSPDGYNLLASAYMQKARETGDFGFNKKAEAALAESFRLAS